MAKKKKKDINKRKETEERDVTEIFEIKKNGKDEIKKVTGKEEVLVESKNQEKEENKILRNVFIGLGVLIVFILLGWFVIDSARQFDYNGMNFRIVKEGSIIFYDVSFPGARGNERVDHHFYIRHDPRKLEEIPFEGNLELADYLILNSTESFNCEGKGIISIANLKMLYEFMGIQVAKDQSADCDPEGKYMFLNIQPGEETKITQKGKSCYTLEINNCEILEGTERFMTETFTKVNDLI